MFTTRKNAAHPTRGRDVLSVGPDADAYLNGHRLKDKSVLLDVSDRLEFIKVRGRKGSDDELRRVVAALENLAETMKQIQSALSRIADHFDPPNRATVTSSYVAERLGRTVRWISELARTGQIPKSCICPRSGDGQYWRFWKDKIDEWIESN